MNKILPLLLGMMVAATSPLIAESIEFDIHSSALNAVANFNQPEFHALETINGEAAAQGQANTSLPGVPDAFDGWAVGGNHLCCENNILWSFNAGSTRVGGLQLINIYNSNEIIKVFRLEFTTDANPTLSSNFNPLAGISVIDGNSGLPQGGTVTGNQLNLSAGRNYHIFFDAVSVTGIRLTSSPNAGTGNGNFVISEVSFQSSAIPEPNTLLFAVFASLLYYWKVRK